MAKSNSGKSESLATNPVGEGDDNEAGEAANAAPGSQATGDSAADFDYLLSMPIWNLTREKVEQMLKERDAKQAEVDVLLKTSPAQLWNADLDDFLVAWEEKLADHEQMERETLAARDAHEKRTNKGKGRAKPKTKRKLTSVDEDNDGMLVEDSDDEDFAPAKKTTRKPSVKTKANSGDAAAKPATQLAATGTLDGFLAKPPEATAQASSGAAGPAKVKIKAKTNPKVSQASKPAVVPSDDSESEDDLSLSLTARMNKLLAARKRKSMGGDSDSDTPDALARPSAPSTTGN
ncbi:DNA topoisomerase 2, partial [Dimargaris verticillata]